MRKEHRESKERLEAERALIDDGIADVESELDAVGALKGIPRTILDEYSHLDRELGRLIDANDFHDELKDLDEEAGPIEADRRATVESAIESLGMTLNSDLADLNARVCGEAMSAPTIVLHSGTKNQYGIGNNVGAGSQALALILFDLEMLFRTTLPAAIHDSSIIGGVEDSVMLEIMDLYGQTGKQVFIAIDKKGSYNNEAGDKPDVLDGTTVLELSRGKELFGRALNLISSEK